VRDQAAHGYRTANLRETCPSGFGACPGQYGFGSGRVAEALNPSQVHSMQIVSARTIAAAWQRWREPNPRAPSRPARSGNSTHCKVQLLESMNRPIV